MTDKPTPPPCLALQLHVIGLYDTARLMAETEAPVIIDPEKPNQSFVLATRWGSSATYYQVHISSIEGACPEVGWQTFRLGLAIDNFNCGVRPLAVYMGAPDDFHSGMARYLHSVMGTGEKDWLTGSSTYDPKDPYAVTQGPVWVLTARRSQ